MSSPHFQRAQLLLEQSRYELAERELRQALADAPNDAGAHALLSLCLIESKKYAEATQAAEQAIHLAPDAPFGHYVLSRVMLSRNRLDQAAEAAQAAIHIDPLDADYWAQMSAIRYEQRRWQDALDAAEAGLDQDAEHVGCTNLRAMTLVKLGRREQAGQTIDAALARNPENAISHANMGWTLLEQRQPEKAMEHFREALRLDPQLDWARAGIVEALKAKHFIYGLMLRYFLWMARLSGQAQWGIVLGAYFGNRLLGGFARSNPEWAPWVLPIQLLYLAFCVLTWIASPLFNLILRLNRFGRLALSREQIVASNWVGGCLLVTGLGIVGWLLFDSEPAGLLALQAGLLLPALAGVFNCSRGWPKWTMTAVAVGLVAWAGWTQLALFQEKFDSVPGMIVISLYGSLAATFASNYLSSVEVKH